MSIEQEKPHDCILWTNLFDGTVEKSQHLNNYQGFLKNLLNQIPTKQMTMNKQIYFDEDEFFLYNVNISAPIHYFFVVNDPENRFFSNLLTTTLRIF